MKTSIKLKIAGCALLLTGAVLIVLALVFKKEVVEGFSMPNFALLIPGIFIAFMSLPVFIIAFAPNMAAAGAKLQQETFDKAENDLRAAALRGAEIKSDSAEVLARAIKKGLTKETIFCKKCGKEIDNDSDFCKFCGIKLK